ncbi:MAG: hypothetical protein IJR90_05825 [Clostridia bacterium]|nr:hypothetical protein [Clostridia bacterium]
MRPILKNLLIVLIVIASLAALYGAAVGVSFLVIRGSRPIEDDELKARMSELIPAAEEVNEIVWGAGLPADPAAGPALASVTGAQYRVVSPEARFQNIDDLLAFISGVYSEPFVREHISYIVYKGDEGLIEEMKPRYKAMKVIGGDGSAVEKLGVDITNKGFTLGAVIDPASVRFTRRVPEWNGLWWSADRIVVTVSETYDGVTSDREISMREKDGVWYLDEATY